ncbi:MAG TPA: hypothetical protein VM686_04805 [Polyangiaceae bacterium]|nr:hypothetical protein [Polyangiaceae bacterium]
MVVAPGSPAQAVYSIDEFLALPLHQRVQFVLQGKLQFYAGDDEVETSTALRWLRETAASR